jgi:hypothetical protein
MAFAYVLPYELPYGSIFKGAVDNEECRRINQTEIPCDSSTNSVNDSLGNEV